MDEPPATPRSDQQLIRAVRSGGPDAPGALYSRHVAAARRLARGLTSHAQDAHGLVAEAFEQAFRDLRRDLGPDAAFRPYLLKLVRDRFRERSRQSGLDSGGPAGEARPEPPELAMVGQAFGLLPERWQLALWHTEVDGESPESVAPVLGVPLAEVSPLLLRARDRLRQRYINEHLRTPPTDICPWMVDQAGAYARAALPASERAAADAHLAGCGGCRALFLELEDINSRLRAVLARAVLGGSTATAYLGRSWLPARISPVWTVTRRLAANPVAQIGTGALAAALTLALMVHPSGESRGPEGQPPVQPGPGPGGVPPAVPADPFAGDGTVGPDPADGAAAPPLALAVSLEPVGSLVRDGQRSSRSPPPPWTPAVAEAGCRRAGPSRRQPIPPTPGRSPPS
jgi:DNA-directed RNA polymerase specialized sigma24 family protein